MGETSRPFIDEKQAVREWREGYKSTAHPLPEVTVEFIETQNTGRTPLEDLRDEVENA